MAMAPGFVLGEEGNVTGFAQFKPEHLECVGFVRQRSRLRVSVRLAAGVADVLGLVDGSTSSAMLVAWSAMRSRLLEITIRCKQREIFDGRSTM